MRIGVVTTSYPRDDDDPAGVFVRRSCQWLLRAQPQVELEVVCADPARALFYRGGAPAQLLDGDGASRLRAAWRALDFSRALAAAVRRRAPAWQAVVSHWLLPCAAIVHTLARGRPHLAVAHGSDVALLRRLPCGARLAAALARSATLIYVSDALRLDGAPGRVVPMGIDALPFSHGERLAMRGRVRAELSVDEAMLLALFLGRVSPEKGCDTFARAIAGCDPRAIIGCVAGDGPERARLRAAHPTLRWLGAVGLAAKARLLAAADVLVMPSRREGAPLALREAQQAGVVPLVSDIAALRALVDDGVDAVVAPVDDAAAFAAALTRLHGEPAWRRTLADAARLRGADATWAQVGPRLFAGWSPWSNQPAADDRNDSARINILRV